MSLNSKAAVAACFATVFIISATTELARGGATASGHARVSAGTTAQI